MKRSRPSSTYDAKADAAQRAKRHEENVRRDQEILARMRGKLGKTMNSSFTSQSTSNNNNNNNVKEQQEADRWKYTYTKPKTYYSKGPVYDLNPNPLLQKGLTKSVGEKVASPMLNLNPCLKYVENPMDGHCFFHAFMIGLQNLGIYIGVPNDPVHFPGALQKTNNVLTYKNFSKSQIQKKKAGLIFRDILAQYYFKLNQPELDQLILNPDSPVSLATLREMLKSDLNDTFSNSYSVKFVSSTNAWADWLIVAPLALQYCRYVLHQGINLYIYQWEFYEGPGKGLWYEVSYDDENNKFRVCNVTNKEVEVESSIFMYFTGRHFDALICNDSKFTVLKSPKNLTNAEKRGENMYGKTCDEEEKKEPILTILPAGVARLKGVKKGSLEKEKPPFEFMVNDKFYSVFSGRVMKKGVVKELRNDEYERRNKTSNHYSVEFEDGETDVYFSELDMLHTWEVIEVVEANLMSQLKL